MSDCALANRCLNYGTKCLRCYNGSLRKEKATQKIQVPKFIADKTSSKKQLTAENSWEDLEQSVADAINQVPTIEQARRSRRSGALWFEKGDIVDSILHPECKERSGLDLKSGGKSMSIKREWLEKAKEECQYSQKFMCLPFRFKEDENTYCIFEMKDIAELVTMTKAYMHDNDKKEQQLSAYKESGLKTIPKRPVLKIEPNYGWYCECGTFLSRIGDKEQCYCYHCGQKILWGVDV